MIAIFALVLIYTGAFFYYRTRKKNQKKIDEINFCGNESNLEAKSKALNYNYYIASSVLLSVIFLSNQNQNYKFLYFIFIILNTSIYFSRPLRRDRH